MPSVPDPAAGDRECERLARGHYENFSVLSGFVPRAQRPHIARLYAYCRTVDDLGDEGPLDASERLAALDAWEADLLRCWEGTPHAPMLQALQLSVRQLGLSRDPFLRLIEANRMDQRTTRHATYADLGFYCEHSANPVGEMVLAVYGLSDPERVRLSDRICTGLQLANFCQDVSVDLAKGRIYLPQEDLARFGVSEPDLMSGKTGPGFRELMAFEVARARELLVTGSALVPRVPASLRLSLGLFVQGGLAILDRLVREDYAVLGARPRLTRLDKASIMARTAWSHVTRRT